MLLKPLLKAIPAITLTLFSGLAYGDLVWENATLEQKARLDSFYQSLNRHQKQRLESMDPKKRSKIQRHIGGLSKHEQKALVSRNHKALINTDINNTKALKLQSMQAISIAQPGSAQLPINRMVQGSNEPSAIPTAARDVVSNLRQLGAGVAPELPLNTTQYRLPAIDALPSIPDTPVLNSLPSIQNLPVLNSLPDISNLPVTSQLPTNTGVVPQILSIPTQILTPEQREQTINTIILDPLNNIRNNIKQDIHDILRIK